MTRSNRSVALSPRGAATFAPARSGPSPRGAATFAPARPGPAETGPFPIAPARPDSAKTESFPGSVFDVAVVLASFRELLEVKRLGALLAVLVLDEDLHLALGLLEHLKTDFGELDALLKDPHGVFKRQLAALQFGDDRFQPGQRFFKFDCSHSLAPPAAHYTPPGFRINSSAVCRTSHSSSPAASRTCTTSPGPTAAAARKTVSSGHRRVMLYPRPRIARGLKAWSVPMESSKERRHNSSATVIRCWTRIRR